ncbi:MAG: HPF/RaiA family ribosome-associated protein [Acidobacteriota bacterium]
MEVEFTARQVKVPKALRDFAQEGMDRIGRILGRGANGNIVFSSQRHLQIVELTIKARLQKIVATGKANSLESALREAIDHAEHQARRYRDRKLVIKRMPKEEKVMTALPVARPKARAAQPPAEPANGNGAGARSKARAAIAVHSFPAKAAVVEPHVVRSGEAFAVRPMTIEEAVKDAEFRDRDLLIFRTAAGETFVLHRRRDGQMELVELP